MNSGLGAFMTDILGIYITFLLESVVLMLSMLSSILFAWRMYLAERAIFSLAAGLILSKRGTT